MIIRKVSIITLIYNNWHLLDSAIRSVANQKINEKYDVEYILLDDGSNDLNVEYINSLLHDVCFENRLIINSENIGTVAALNKAIEISSGDIIVPLSADDCFYDDKVVNDIIVEFEKSNVLIVTGLRIPVANGIENASLPAKIEWGLFSQRELLLRYILLHGNIISGASTYYHRNIFSEIGFFDTAYRLIEDYPYYVKALTLGYDIKILKRNTIKYGVDGVSSSSVANPIVQNDFLAFLKLILDRNDMSLMDRRSIYFNRVLTCSQRKQKSLQYLDQVIFRFLKKKKRSFLKMWYKKS
ncbi:glycosyltransferase [Aeromonas veronii]|uniref:glycosyltransferase n=1 Tax=Aeromonas veronii TaxID=654 RepID=UPI00191DF081|nr:glycosyltransferase [Aeromonas veronii]MBL0455456.1 glycosyltransferase [Aeromonas veronii]HDZ8981802.1 glycosyltransferase [Aeromonas veronii]HEA3127245.1 glycosyltransferase [Aeromonas veronii]